MTIRPLLALVAGAAAAVLLLAAGCGGGDPASGGSTTGTESVDVVLDWYPNADHAGIFGAISQGYFADHGLDVTTTVPSDAAAALKQVGAGKAPFAISYEPEVMLARSEGIPVVAVGAIVTHPLNSIIVRSDSGIERPKELEGKTVGNTGLPLERPLLRTVVAADGGDPDRVEVQNVGYNLSPALAAGRVDAVIGAYWNIELVELDAQGIDAKAFRVEEYGVPDYDELVVVTGDRFAREHPETVRRFLEALRQGQDWAATDQAGAVDALVSANPDLDRDTVAEQVGLTADLFSPPDGGTLAMDPDEWAAFARWMRSTGQLPADADVDGAMTTRFLPQTDG